MRKSIILFAAVGLIFASCQKSNDNIIDNDTPTTMEELKIDDSFDWKTTKTFEITVDLPREGRLEPITLSSADESEVYFKGYPDDGTRLFKTIVTLPSYKEHMLLTYGQGLRVAPFTFELNSEQIFLDINAIVVTNKGAATYSYCDEDDGYVDNGNDDQTTYNGFQFDFNGRTVNGDGTSTWSYTITGVGAPKDLSHWVLSFCEEMGGEDVLSASPNNWEVNTDPTTNVYGLKWDQEVGKNGDSKTFTFTLDGVYDVEPVEFTYKAGQARYYCTINGPSCEESDDNGGGNGGGDDDDDGNTYPASGEGTLAYEDLWPEKGDYDFNDLVVDYTFEISKDNSERIQEIEASFEIKATGASFHNGFAFTFPNVPAEAIASVSGQNVESGVVYNLAANGVEEGVDIACIPVYDDSYDILAHPGTGIGVNTELDQPYMAPQTITITITFVEDAVTWSQLDIGNFNPFITVNQEREIEVHLPNYDPTALVDNAYFGTGDDDSNLSQDRTYVTSINLPWAIHIAEEFDYPLEKVEILNAHLKFAEWAESNGAEYPDWYKDLEGYRNDANIYPVPDNN